MQFQKREIMCLEFKISIEKCILLHLLLFIVLFITSIASTIYVINNYENNMLALIPIFIGGIILSILFPAPKGMSPG